MIWLGFTFAVVYSLVAGLIVYEFEEFLFLDIGYAEPKSQPRF